MLEHLDDLESKDESNDLVKNWVNANFNQQPQFQIKLTKNFLRG